MTKTRSQTLHPSPTKFQLDDPQKNQLDNPQQRRRDESLRLLLTIYGGGSVSYTVLSFTGLHLFDFSDETNSGKTENQPPQLEEIRFPSGSNGDIFAMGLCVSGSKLYLVGGQKRESDDWVKDTDLPGCENLELQSCDFDTEDKDPLLVYSCYDYSPSVFVVKFEDSQPLEVWELPAMVSGKACPTVVEVEETLYVLAGMPMLMLPKPAFEAYNINRKKWEGLNSPRFLQPHSKYFEDPRIRSFVVISKTIHVSTSSSSYSYHTERREWSRCALFDDAPPELRHPWVDDDYATHFSWMNHWNRNEDEEKDYGLPFNFDGGAVLYGEDVRIVLVPSHGVVAFKLVDGKVKYYKSLEDLEIPSGTTLAYLVDFKEGNLCLVFFLNPYQAIEEGKPVIFIKPFHFLKRKYHLCPKDENTKILNWSDDDDHEKLNDKNWIYYEVGKTISPEFTQELANKNWIILDCFAL